METIKFEIDIKEPQNKYKHITDNKDFYSSSELFEAYQNYRKSKRGDYDLLTGMINGAVDNGFNAISHTFNKSFDEAVRKAIDKAVKGAVIKSGGKWTD